MQDKNQNQESQITEKSNTLTEEVLQTETKIKLRPTYNWDALKLEFMRGPWNSVSAFRAYKKMPPINKSSRVNNMMNGWGKEKMELISKAAKLAAQTLVADKMEEFKKVRERQATLARKMQEKGEEILPKLDPKNIEEARKLIQTGMQEERNALGLGEKGGASSLTQVNVNLPKTKFDNLIDGGDFESILKFIADIKRERIRRTREVPVIESETEIE